MVGQNDLQTALLGAQTNLCLSKGRFEPLSAGQERAHGRVPPWPGSTLLGGRGSFGAAAAAAAAAAATVATAATRQAGQAGRQLRWRASALSQRSGAQKKWENRGAHARRRPLATT